MSETHFGEVERQRQKLQQQLDEALAESFPASDPVSIVTSGSEEYWGVEPQGAVSSRVEPA
jgi:hypothetical protein